MRAMGLFMQQASQHGARHWAPERKSDNSMGWDNGTIIGLDMVIWPCAAKG